MAGGLFIFTISIPIATTGALLPPQEKSARKRIPVLIAMGGQEHSFWMTTATPISIRISTMPMSSFTKQDIG